MLRKLFTVEELHSKDALKCNAEGCDLLSYVTCTSSIKLCPSEFAERFSEANEEIIKAIKSEHPSPKDKDITEEWKRISAEDDQELFDVHKTSSDCWHCASNFGGASLSPVQCVIKLKKHADAKWLRKFARKQIKQAHIVAEESILVMVLQ